MSIPRYFPTFVRSFFKIFHTISHGFTGKLSLVRGHYTLSQLLQPCYKLAWQIFWEECCSSDYLAKIPEQIWEKDGLSLWCKLDRYTQIVSRNLFIRFASFLNFFCLVCNLSLINTQTHEQKMSVLYHYLGHRINIHQR